MAFIDSAYRKTACLAEVPVIKLAQGQQTVKDVVLRDDQGNPLNLSELLSPVDSSSSGGAALAVKLAVSQCLNASNVEYTLDGEVVSAEDGEVRFAFEPSHTDKPGFFVASMGAFVDDVLRANQMFYIEVAPTNFVTNTGGPISIAEVRMELMDTCPDANYLLDELEFTDADILHAIRKAVDVFNELPPPIGGYPYDAFPFRANWMKAAAGFLLQTVSHKYRRNRLQYSAGGVTIADQEKAEEYFSVGKRLEQEYVEWALQRRISMNIRSGFGSVGGLSPFA